MYNKPELLCQQCGIKIDKGKYCSRNCYWKARKEGKYKPYWKGKTRSKKTKEKISKANKGKKPWCWGKKLSDEHRDKLSKAKIGKYIGKKHPNWKGGHRVDGRGYVRIWIDKKTWRYEHRLIMEKYLKRKLKRTEIVHHVNQNKQDNRLENLMLFPNNKAHLRYHREILKMKTKNQYSENTP